MSEEFNSKRALHNLDREVYFFCYYGDLMISPDSRSEAIGAAHLAHDYDMKISLILKDLHDHGVEIPDDPWDDYVGMMRRLSEIEQDFEDAYGESIDWVWSFEGEEDEE